jgi:prenylcysteine alpha-carboxyl methylesterase
MMRRRGRKPQGTTVATVQEDESLNEQPKSMSIVTEEELNLDEMAAKVERVAASAPRASFYQLESSVYAFSDNEPLLSPTAADSTPRSPSRRLPTPRTRHTREFPAASEQRRASIRPLQDFRLRYHARLVVKQSWRMLKMLIHGTPRWITTLARLICFVASMIPAFIVFGVFYVVTSDRIAVPYKQENRTSRHYLDIYGSTNNGNQNGSNNASREQQLKPVILFLTGGAWIIGYKMWGALLARALVPFGILVVIPDYRNFPQTNVDGMIEDADLAVDWTLKNIRKCVCVCVTMQWLSLVCLPFCSW